MTATEILSGWGRWPKRACVTAPLDEAAVQSDGPPAISRGMGRSYGDAAMNPRLTLKGTHRDRILSFDMQTGVLVAEGGVPLSQMLATFAPRGWFPSVTPGTKFVTLAGLIAVDAHGKNHHGAGSFGDHVDWIDLLCADGEVRRCSPSEHADLFNATIGGMGLTGHILAAQIRLMRIGSSYIRQVTQPAANLDHAIEIFEQTLSSTYSVAWIDCLASGADLGRSLIMLGEHADPETLSGAAGRRPNALPPKPARKMPMDAPSWMLNKYSIRAFNHVYYDRGSRAAGTTQVDYDTYFYPLDSIRDWNRLYGKRGFAQYQCALPLAASRDGMRALLDAISQAGLGSFLAVLKRLGRGATERPLSFPIEGYTLALDFAMTPEALTLFTQLDDIVIDHGGRLYLAKDSRMTQATFEKTYGGAVDQFRSLRAQTGASSKFQSLMSERLGL